MVPGNQKTLLESKSDHKTEIFRVFSDLNFNKLLIIHFIEFGLCLAGSNSGVKLQFSFFTRKFRGLLRGQIGILKNAGVYTGVKSTFFRQKNLRVLSGSTGYGTPAGPGAHPASYY